jgi:murein DD-endopeptidase MepM/ murein hydrolase activator NlpD
VALIAFALVAAPAGAGAQQRSSDEIAEELRREEQRARQLGEALGEVRADIATAEVELAELGARLNDARGRLRVAEGQVALGEAALEDAERAHAAAERDHVRAEDALTRTEAELAVEEAVLHDQIVESFKYGTAGATRGAMLLEVLRRAEDPNAFAVGMKQLKVVVDVQESTVQRVFELRDQRADRREEAARARGRAAQAAAEAAAALRHLEQLRDDAAELTAAIEADEARQQVVLASLREDEAGRAAVLDRVATRQQQLERELVQRRAEEEAARIAAAEREAARQRAAEEAARRSASAERGDADAGSGGGGTGGSSGGGSSAPPPSQGAAGGPPIGGGFCPVVGAVAGRDFSNDWGYPRSGGRTHQGNDLFANEGVPVVAIQGGVVVRTTPVDRGLGGITVTYRTGDGSEWYNAHLRDIAEGIVPGVVVEAGQQIGTVGRTGNARTTPPHLHLGRRYQGSWVNPYPTIAPLCR